MKVKHSELIHVVIETPRGSRNKYKYDEEKKVFLLKKVLPLGTVFPFDFGFISDTKGEDGDPLDIMVLMDIPVFPGCVVDCRILGVLEAEQKEKKKKKIRNDRILAVESNSLTYADIKTIDDVNEKLLDEMIGFFKYYNETEGKKFSVVGKEDAGHAKKIIKKGMNGISPSH
jgi:inorganic pyrophosphatase